MATKEEKQLNKELKRIKQQEKSYEDEHKARLKSQKARAKEERKPAKVARKQTNRERDRRQALVKFRKARDNFLGLPPVLWPFVAMVAYIWARNTWEKERQERDLREARRFLRESRGMRI